MRPLLNCRVRFNSNAANRSAALFTNTSILLSGPRAVAAGSCEFMRINKRWPSGDKQNTDKNNLEQPRHRQAVKPVSKMENEWSAGEMVGRPGPASAYDIV